MCRVKAYDLGKPFFDPTSYDELKIRCETLDLKDDGEYDNGIPAPNFFDSFPLATPKEHQIITLDDSARRDYQTYENIFDRAEEVFATQALSYLLMRHFDWFRRNGIPSHRGRLRDITVWRQAEFSDFRQEYFMPGVYDQRGYSPSPAAWWRRIHRAAAVAYRISTYQKRIYAEFVVIAETSKQKLCRQTQLPASAHGFMDY
ncbi:hypothetical protein IFM53868_05954 [Aspergillus udagawae]|uniref:Uncharacterized protein n=1 Tax=Aspergillus udagawae TaxID=91492 RepID=A0ABQ1AXD2_9EURO|nr:hypothetical protein IFM53868_05954 [Aspergillus udagawae]